MVDLAELLEETTGRWASQWFVPSRSPGDHFLTSRRTARWQRLCSLHDLAVGVVAAESGTPDAGPSPASTSWIGSRSPRVAPLPASSARLAGQGGLRARRVVSRDRRRFWKRPRSRPTAAVVARSRCVGFQTLTQIRCVTARATRAQRVLFLLSSRGAVENATARKRPSGGSGALDSGYEFRARLNLQGHHERRELAGRLPGS